MFIFVWTYDDELEDLLTYPPSLLSEEPNQLNLVADRGGRADRDRYARARKLLTLYQSAARLWRDGVNMTKAISIVNKAMRDAGEL